MITLSLIYLLDAADFLVERGYSFNDVMSMHYWEFEHILKRQNEKDKIKKRQQEEQEEQTKSNSSLPKYKQPAYRKPNYKHKKY